MSGIVAIRVDNGDRATPRDTKSYGAYRAVAKAIQRQGNVPVPLHVVSSFNDMTDVMQRHGQERILFGVLDEETLGDKFTEAVDHLKREKGTPILTIAARGKDPYTQIDPEFALHRPLASREAMHVTEAFLKARVQTQDYHFGGFHARFANDGAQLLNLDFARMPSADVLRTRFKDYAFIREQVPDQLTMTSMLNPTQMELLALMLKRHDAMKKGRLNSTLKEDYCSYVSAVGTTSDFCGESHCSDMNALIVEIRFLRGAVQLMSKGRIDIQPIRDHNRNITDFMLVQSATPKQAPTSDLKIAS